MMHLDLFLVSTEIWFYRFYRIPTGQEHSWHLLNSVPKVFSHVSMLDATAAYPHVIGHKRGMTANPACKCKRLQHSSEGSDHAFALLVVRPPSWQCSLRQPTQVTDGFDKFWGCITPAHCIWILESQANKVTKARVHKVRTL